jgi:RNA recognition motif-containing protein
MSEEKKVYLGNLSYDVVESDLTQAMTDKGLAAQSVSVITDRMTGRSRGFGFAEFATSDEAKKAVEMLDGVDLCGRALRVNIAQDKPRKPRNDSFGGGRDGGFRGGNKNRW